ncbi:hypothetical protein XZ90_001488 [Salmonella enterica subsp. enterica]|uniref:DNA-binding protein n=1 Tax=Citrobacter braakii TaxID=57706 RepID=A0A1V8NU15_CITBR|nr:hypothetical protein [Citrobacter braakii]EBW7149107.1 hypothetical protein [Salmonella enterica subsp. enterica serovar Coeln]EDV0068805.1 hypothetical protein [Salmonella enterica subsp. enterica serovar Litchfield]EDV1957994.1 hypothetical protein [Salmonella enterica subsp. enterica serovar Litchfield]OQM39908.1 hypothetical protein BZK42_21840 [Citrobacter braakii]QXC16640.1 hypothetical protein I6L51_00430 [Citrobacter braakii]
MALNQAEEEILERKTARWVYEQGRGVTAKEVAKRFRLHIHMARLVIHRIMRRTDGIRCELLGTYEKTRGGSRLVKYFSVIYLPKEYQPKGSKTERYPDNER